MRAYEIDRNALHDAVHHAKPRGGAPRRRPTDFGAASRVSEFCERRSQVQLPRIPFPAIELIEVRRILARVCFDCTAWLSGSAVNPDRSGGDIAAQWQNSSPQVAIIDNLLTDEALERLRQYCWRSTIWHKSYANGYLGAMPEHGFACPLVAQIADELRDAYPAILHDYPLLRCWGFKYDSRHKGINIHADFAAVNVNFWIAPEEANLDPQSGGLVIWDKPAPLEWTFEQYNNPNSGQMIRNLLAQAGAKSVTVPHRANRAVIFDSDLFHETDRIVFKEGYVNRRINITMLYGRREKAAKQN